jgi:hypothetical protein
LPGRSNAFYDCVQADEKFLGKLKSIDICGKYGFAFDTKFDSRMSGSAAKFIEKELRNLGLQILLYENLQWSLAWMK